MNLWIKPSTEQRQEIKEQYGGEMERALGLTCLLGSYGTSDKTQIFQASFSPSEENARWALAFISVLATDKFKRLIFYWDPSIKFN